MLYKIHKSDTILLKEAVEKLRKDSSGDNKHLANDVELLAGRLEAIYNHENKK